MELMPGYKTTDIGVIPSDWEAATIGEVATFSGGSQPPRSTFKFSPAAGYVRLIQIRDYKTDEYASYIPATMARKTCSSDDIMIGRYGPPIFQILRGIEGAYNVALIKTIPNERISRDYLFNILSQEKLFQLIDSLSRRSSGQTGVEMPALKAFGLPLPPIEEQQAISTALSDVNALLATLDQMVAKKRDLKQATMQQLLTGETRLPGFCGKWDVKQIGEFTDCTAGGTPSTLNPAYWGGEIPWMSSGELHLKRVKDVEGRITELGLNNSSTKKIPPYCVLIGLAGQGKTRGTVAINMIELCTNQSIAAIFPNASFNSEYLFHNLDALYDELRELSTGGGGRGGLNLKIIKSIKIPFPSLEEQDAIASVLSDMDTDLASLESRRSKTRDIKQAMMQELLTGKTRLV